MSPVTPVSAQHDAAREARRALERDIARADELWRDAARKRFDTAHLERIRGEARVLEASLAAVAEACLRVDLELGAG